MGTRVNNGSEKYCPLCRTNGKVPIGIEEQHDVRQPAQGFDLPERNKGIAQKPKRIFD
jgi:hypothetical protein